MPRRTTDDQTARTAAADLIESAAPETNGGDVVAAFDTAEFETTTSKVGGRETNFRRVVLTGKWEIAPA